MSWSNQAPDKADCAAALLLVVREAGSLSLLDAADAVAARYGRPNPFRPMKEQDHDSADSSDFFEHFVLAWAQLTETWLLDYDKTSGQLTLTLAGHSWLLDHPDGGAHELRHLFTTLEFPGIFQVQWAPNERTIDRIQLTRKVEEIIAEGLPAEATQFRRWVVGIRGKPVSVKWLFHLATGAEYHEFNTATARSALSYVGFCIWRLHPQVVQQARAEFLEQLQRLIPEHLPPALQNAEVFYHPRTDYVQLRYREFPRSHYELALRRDRDEIGFHFEGTRQLNLARLQCVQKHEAALSAQLGQRVVAVPWGNNRARLAIDLPPGRWAGTTPSEYAELMARFIEHTHPLLRDIFAATAPRRGRRPADSVGAQSDRDSRAHAKLDEQISQIRRYLSGRAVRPSDEVLCDWVQFCYTFQLYREAVELFERIDPTAVHEWPYARAKRLAQVCRLRMGE